MHFNLAFLVKFNILPAQLKNSQDIAHSFHTASMTPSADLRWEALVDVLRRKSRSVFRPLSPMTAYAYEWIGPHTLLRERGLAGFGQCMLRIYLHLAVPTIFLALE